MMMRLEHPIALDDGSMIAAVILREPTMQDVEATAPEWLMLRPGEDPGDTFEAGLDLMERLAELPREVFEQMDASDYVSLCDLVAELLFGLRRRLEPEKKPASG